MDREELIAKSQARDITIAEAKNWLREVNVYPGSTPLVQFSKKNGKKKTQMYLTLVFAMEILEDQNIKYLDGEKLLPLVVSKIPKDLHSQATTIQGLLKDWIGIFVTKVDYMTLTYEMALNIVKIRKALRKMLEKYPSIANKICAGDQSSLLILNEVSKL